MAAPPRPSPLSKKKGPKGPDPAAVAGRKRGALIGLAVGDALGATLRSRKLVVPGFPTLVNGPHTELVGGGPWRLKPGQVTSPTHQACCVAQVLKVHGRYDVPEAVKAFNAWKPHAPYLSDAMKAVLDLLAERVWPERASREVWFQSQRRAAGNEALCRTVPIGVRFAADPAARIKASLDDAALTHFDPRCQIYSVVLDAALGAAITSVDAPKLDELFDAALLDLPNTQSQLAQSIPELLYLVTEATELVRQDLRLARQEDPQLYGPEVHLFNHETYVRTAFRLAFWELAHAPTFEAALLDVVNRGGDAAANGAVAGALLGAVHGERGIPDRWRAGVLEALGLERPSPFRDTYHPRKLLTLLDE